MASPSSADGPTPLPKVIKGSSRHIIGFVYFTFIAYLSIGLPLAVLPPYVHLRMGYSATLAGLVISIQYMATLVSRPWAGRISDRAGAKVSVLWGMAACSVSGGVLTAAALLHAIPWLSLTVLLVSRLLLGIGESLGSTGSTLWGISSAGQANMAKVISFNGIATYGAMALGAPLGVILDQYGGLGGIGLLILLIGAFSLVLASRKSPVPVTHGEHLPFRDVMFRVAPHGFGLALGGVGFSVLATFVTLFYASRHWTGAALCLTAFGAAFIAARLIFIQAINRYGGFPVGMACLSVESLGLLLLWRANAPWIALGRRAHGLWLLAGFSGDRRRGGQARSSLLPWYRARRIHRLLRRLLLSGRSCGRCGHWRLRLRQCLSLRFGLCSRRAGNRGCAAPVSVSIEQGRTGVFLPILPRSSSEMSVGIYGCQLALDEARQPGQSAAQ